MQLLTCSTDVSLKALGRPHLYAQHCIMKCAHCSENDRTAVSALGRVHLYMTGAHAAFERTVYLSLTTPSLFFPCTLAQVFQEKSPSSFMPPSPPPLPKLPQFLTQSFSGANLQNISPPGFRGVAALPLNCYSFPIALSVSSPPTSSPLLARIALGKMGDSGESLFGGESLVT